MNIKVGSKVIVKDSEAEYYNGVFTEKEEISINKSYVIGRINRGDEIDKETLYYLDLKGAEEWPFSVNDFKVVLDKKKIG